MLSILKQRHALSNIKPTMLTDNSPSDVTLVSDDLQQFQAHKYILGIFSPVLKNILLTNPHPNPMIYLQGIKGKDLHNILEFIYHGNSLVDYSAMNRLSQAAEDLQIKQLTNKILKVISQLGHNASKEEVIQENSGDENDQLYKFEERDTTYKRQRDFNNSTRRKQKDGGNIHLCEFCEFKARFKSSVLSHIFIFEVIFIF